VLTWDLFGRAVATGVTAAIAQQTAQRGGMARGTRVTYQMALFIAANNHRLSALLRFTHLGMVAAGCVFAEISL